MLCAVKKLEGSGYEIGTFPFNPTLLRISSSRCSGAQRRNDSELFLIGRRLFFVVSTDGTAIQFCSESPPRTCACAERLSSLDTRWFKRLVYMLFGCLNVASSTMLYFHFLLLDAVNLFLFPFLGTDAVKQLNRM